MKRMPVPASILLPPRMNEATRASVISAMHATYVTLIEATKAWGTAALGGASGSPE